MPLFAVPVMAEGSHPVPARRWRRRTCFGAIAAAIVGVAAFRAAVAVVQVTNTGLEDASLEPGQAERKNGVMWGLLQYLRTTTAPLQRQVDAGHIIPKFGEKAQTIVSALSERAGDAGPELERIVDGKLEMLFLKQLALLRQQLAGKFEKASRPLDAASQADAQFVVQAEELLRPGSRWSYEHERYALRAVLEGSFRKEAMFAEEKVKALQAQQSTVEIISKLQSQMEVLQQKVQNLRAGSPWFLSTSYRIPHTPLQLIGRYQQGRANLELSLNQDRDPANSEAGFVEGVGPANLGITLNLGF